MLIDKKKLRNLIIILIVVLLPFKLVQWIEPEWLGRMIALGYCYFGIAIFSICMVVIHHKIELKPYIEARAKDPEIVKRNFRNLYRVFGALFLIFTVIWAIIPYIKSASYLFSKPLVNRGGVLTSWSSGLWLAYYFSQSLGFDGESDVKGYYALNLHSPLKEGKRYEFLYIPDTRLILEIREVEN